MKSFSERKPLFTDRWLPLKTYVQVYSKFYLNSKFYLRLLEVLLLSIKFNQLTDGKTSKTRQTTFYILLQIIFLLFSWRAFQKGNHYSPIVGCL